MYLSEANGRVPHQTMWASRETQPRTDAARHPEHVKKVDIGELRCYARYPRDTESNSKLALLPTYLAFQQNLYVSKSAICVTNPLLRLDTRQV
jgi:hypothetical protein